MKSAEINELAAALATAQGQISGASKDSINPHFKSNYADLGSVWDACREPLSKNGLAITQTIGHDGLVTTLMHKSGQWIDSTHPLNPADSKPQTMGSLLSYARRYSLAAMVGVFQVDDDSEAAQAAVNTHAARAQEKPRGAAPIASAGHTKPTAAPAISPKIAAPAIAHGGMPSDGRERVVAAAARNNWSNEAVSQFIDSCYNTKLVRDLTPEQIEYLIKTISTMDHMAAMAVFSDPTAFNYGANAPKEVK